MPSRWQLNASSKKQRHGGRLKCLRPKATQQVQEESWKDGFVDEITFQFKIKHANVVRLVGCCLETDIPILEFEFVGTGSLDDELHVRRSTLSLLQRLEIAIGSAEGLSHMHSAEHVHGDVKPSNILLDDDLNPKVSDFGSSKLLSAKRYATEVAADGKYVDPMYYSTGRFTEKSDVYSFGVVLLELITRKKAWYGDGEDHIIAIEFKKACKTHGNGRKMYDAEILSNGDAHYAHRCVECLDMVGTLAVRCLNTDYPDERPKMAAVVEELQQAKKIFFFLKRWAGALPIQLRRGKRTFKVQKLQRKQRTHTSNKMLKNKNTHTTLITLSMGARRQLPEHHFILGKIEHCYRRRSFSFKDASIPFLPNIP
ncbi:hypothetical protein U9M48_000700 [Paspalum notatum var. saurae]|uniref:Protein kinase domain-containing protein n=1 Tax=Paspalum notatum var. saurae TaxID=547442 RepID=A0AAQ3PFG9_PASNO